MRKMYRMRENVADVPMSLISEKAAILTKHKDELVLTLSAAFNTPVVYLTTEIYEDIIVLSVAFNRVSLPVSSNALKTIEDVLNKIGVKYSMIVETDEEQPGLVVFSIEFWLTGSI